MGAWHVSTTDVKTDTKSLPNIRNERFRSLRCQYYCKKNMDDTLRKKSIRKPEKSLCNQYILLTNMDDEMSKSGDNNV